jgi:glyoxylase-like metal-dependent hydrolase (beta-lactamase superfamily II)
VFIAGFPANAFGTNCFVVATAPGEECVVVDPGMRGTGQLDDLLAEHRLAPVAVLLTHGHLDHTFSVTPVCHARGIPAYLHPGDDDMLVDPIKGLSADITELFGGSFEWAEPEDVRQLSDGEAVTLAGIEITVDHAPGHTRGSVLFRFPTDPSSPLRFAGRPGRVADEAPVCLSGDVLFAGSIGRTDLPGGNSEAMFASLRDRILPLPDETVVLPGHGPATTIGRERATNPYLRQVADAKPGATPTRGW